MRRFTPAACLALIVFAAGCQTPPPPPPVVYVPPPPPPAPPPLIVLPKERALASAIIEEAAAFQQAMTTAAGIDPVFADGEAVAKALRTGAAFEPKQTQRGAVAFVAITALAQPDFADGFREYSIDDEARADLARKLVERPDYAASFPHADKAAGLAIARLDSLGAKAWVQGRAVQQAAYDVQRQPWAKLPVADRELRLANAKAISGQRLTPSPSDVEALRTAALTPAPISPISTPVAGPYHPVIYRGLALAALVALGEAGDNRAEAITTVLDDAASLDCLNTAKLMLYQCLAGSDRGHYEDIFCLGEHGMSDIGRCMVQAAGSPNPAFVPPPPPPPPVAPEPKAKAKAKAAPRRR